MASWTRSPLSAALAGMAAMAVAIGVDRFVYTPILPLMVSGLGISRFTAGLIASANYAGYLAGASLAVIPLPGSRRTWLLGSLLVSVLVTAAMGLTRSVALFLALQVVSGLASAFAFVFVSTIVLEVALATARGSVPAVMYTGVGVGITASAILVSLLRVGVAHWNDLWLAAALLSLCGTIAVAILVPDGTPRAAVAKRETRLTHRSRAPFVRLASAYGLFGFGYIITATFLVALVRSNPALRSIEPVVWVAFGVAAAVSTLIWTALARPLGPARAFALALIAEAIGVLATVTWQTASGIIIAAILVGGTFMGIVTIALVRARRYSQGDGRRELALMTLTFGIGQIIGPSFAGALFDRLGSLLVPSAAAAGTLVLAAILTIRDP